MFHRFWTDGSVHGGDRKDYGYMTVHSARMGVSGFDDAIAGSRATRGRFRRLPPVVALLLVSALVVAGLLTLVAHPASAAGVVVAQCNNDTASNVGGQGIACTVTIENYVTATGALAATAPSTLTVTRCVGAAGPIGAGGGACTTTTTTSAEPVTSVQQCNGSGNGGGGVVKCAVVVNNHFSGAPAAAPAPATVYQCVGSVITGSGAPGTCTPANTPGVTSVTAATVGQCNGSGNGGTSVGFVCTVNAASTMSSTLPINIDQCNGSANGGGSLVTCTAGVTNEITAAPTATATPVTPGASATPGLPTATPTASSPSGSATATPTGSRPAGSATPTGTATGQPTTATPTAPASTTSATSTPTGGATPGSPTPTRSAPLPPATGNASATGSAGSAPWTLWLLGLAAIVLSVLTGHQLVSRRASRSHD